jgi:hypothetical protein
MMIGYDEDSSPDEEEDLLDRAWKAYRATEPRPRLYASGVFKYHSYFELRLDREERVVNWFLSLSRELVN